jgi:hypothetical protein
MVKELTPELDSDLESFLAAELDIRHISCYSFL